MATSVGGPPALVSIGPPAAAATTSSTPPKDSTPAIPPAGADVFHWWSYHGDGGHFMFVDGSARMLSYSIDQNVLLSLSSRNGDDNAETSQ